MMEFRMLGIIGAGLVLALVMLFIMSRRRATGTRRAPPRPRAAPGSGVIRARMAAAALPTLVMTTARDPAFSKIGGQPELPVGMPWPRGENGPRVFVAQIDLGAVPSETGLDWLPREGRIYGFFDDDRNGAVDCVQVIYTKEPPGPAIEPPESLPKTWRFTERRVEFDPFMSLPSFDWMAIEPSDADLESEDLESLCEEFNLFLGDVAHRIGGYPDEIQSGQMAIECEYLHRGLRRNYAQPVPAEIQEAAEAWRLLLQIDTDDDLHMNWWDGGLLYVFVREEDARAGDFSRTVTITQTH